MIRAYLVDEGILLKKGNPEFEQYATAYDKEYGYWDEAQFYMEQEQEAIAEAKKYVENGVDGTYAVVSVNTLPDNFDFEAGNEVQDTETYLVADVIYSAAKVDGNIVENFVKGVPI